MSQAMCLYRKYTNPDVDSIMISPSVAIDIENGGDFTTLVVDEPSDGRLSSLVRSDVRLL